MPRTLFRVPFERLDTAYERWDRWWDEALLRDRWHEPERAVVDVINELSARGAVTVVDVGAGIGRHSLAYARAGLKVVAVDASRTGLHRLRTAAGAEGLGVGVATATFGTLPFRTGSVDHVLAWNVIYHGDRGVVSDALAEFARILRPGGTLQCTLLSKRNLAYGVGEEIRPGTFVDRTSVGDKDHPHFYVDAVEVAALLDNANFELRTLVDVDQAPPGGWHWTVHATARQV